MKHFFKLIAAIVLSASLFISCASDTSQSIAPAEARELLKNDASVLLVDVRTLAEHEQARIEGSLLLTHDSINQESAATIIPNKASTVLVYCRSGRRSSAAVKALTDMGYTKIFDLGGLNSWPYTTISGPREAQ